MKGFDMHIGKTSEVGGGGEYINATSAAKAAKLGGGGVLDALIKGASPDPGKGVSISSSANLPESEYREVCAGTYDGDFVQVNNVRHFKYDDANPQDLVSVGDHRVHKDAAAAFKDMQRAASADGCTLYIVSGTRPKKYQVTVFKKKFIDKNNPTPEEMNNRVRWSAPSGYSEHHTGYAIDINSTSPSFKNTKEYEWLKAHAAEYGFEISFPENNKQGLGFEPWHWRYVGTKEAQQTFNAARRYQNS